MGMINGIHGDAARGGPDAQPAAPPGLSQIDIGVVGISHHADGGHAIQVHAANLAGTEANLRVIAFFARQLGRTAGAAGQLRALAGPEFDAMDHRAQGDVPQRQGVAHLDFHGFPGHHRIAHPEPFGMDDVALLAVRIHHQGDAGAPVGIVFHTGHLARHAGLVASEINNPVAALVAATLMAHRNAAGVVPAPFSPQGSQQGALRLVGGELLEGGDAHAPAAGRSGVISSDSHRSSRAQAPSKYSM